MDTRLVDLFFKALAGGLIPVLLWVNSISVDIAVIQDKLSNLERRVTQLEQDMKSTDVKFKEADNRVSKVASDLNSTNLVMRELGVTIRFISDIVEEIRHDLQGK